MMGQDNGGHGGTITISAPPLPKHQCIGNLETPMSFPCQKKDWPLGVNNANKPLKPLHSLTKEDV